MAGKKEKKTEKTKPAAKRVAQRGKPKVGKGVKRPARKKAPAPARRREEPAVKARVKEAAKLTVPGKDDLRKMLLRVREALVQQIGVLAGDALKRTDRVNIEEDGSDEFERELALQLASSDHDSVFEVDEALRRLDEGVYGICEECEKPIEVARLNALPFVRLCVSCQGKREARMGLHSRVSLPAR